MLDILTALINAQYICKYIAFGLSKRTRICNKFKLVQLQNFQPSRIRALLKNRKWRSKLDNSK